ncbi:hypothetical protein PV11_05785 [Exophiala sideris]|uniref:Uncharacterized protein n=1 Tax=Exophiala sideris TaxID=1016849 RepID=A0A0D1X7H9_9EURO|nr:hypothetical protein PV11_05785 [Exophiala sideris]
MENCFYETSWLVHSIPKLTASFAALLTPPSTHEQVRHRYQLSTHADTFRDTLSHARPHYEYEEEKEKLGVLRQCKWTRLGGDASETAQADYAGRKRKRADSVMDGSLDQGILISLVYEKTTYRFVLYTTNINAAKRSRSLPWAQSCSRSQKPTAVLLSKSSPSVLRSLTNYLYDTFAVDNIHPLQLPSTFIQGTLQRYLSSIYSSLETASNSQQGRVQDTFINVISTVKVHIAFSAPVAPHLKSLEVAIAPYAVLKAMPENGNSGKDYFMGAISSYIHANTGLILPVADEEEGSDDGRHAIEADSPKPEPPMKISRISNAAYAISCDHRLKFVLRAVDAVHGSDSPEENCVRRANQEVLDAVVEEAARQAADDG